MDCTSNNNPVQPFNRSNDHQPYSCGSSNEIRPIGTAGQNNLPPKKDNFSATPKYLFDAEPPSELEQVFFIICIGN